MEGKRNGPYTEWFSDGKLKVKGQFIKGAKTGLWTVQYDESDYNVPENDDDMTANIAESGDMIADRDINYYSESGKDYSHTKDKVPFNEFAEKRFIEFLAGKGKSLLKMDRLVNIELEVNKYGDLTLFIPDRSLNEKQEELLRSFFEEEEWPIPKMERIDCKAKVFLTITLKQ